MKWIPCEERLPNDNREVLISLEWGIDIGTYERGEWRSEWINHYDDDNVLAWMPLPQPYTADRKTENSSEIPNNCDTCRNKGFEGCEQPCLGCGCCGLYEPKDEPTSSKMEQVDKDINVRSKDEPKTQTETQNSNLTFKTLEYCDICDHKGCEECVANALDEHCMPSQFNKQIEDECAKEYEELGLKELKELIEADRKDESLTEGVWNAGYKTGYDKGYKDAQKFKDSQDLVKDLVKAFCEDGTWLERQGAYTLTLAEAKQRAVDIIESVLATDEPQTDCAWK